MRFLIVLIIFVFNSTALAEKLDRAEINKSLQDIQSISLKHKGKSGVWFSEQDSDKILILVEEKLPQALDIIDGQDREILLLKNAIKSYINIFYKT